MSNPEFRQPDPVTRITEALEAQERVTEALRAEADRIREESQRPKSTEPQSEREQP